MDSAKYICTKNNQIIVFSPALTHDMFKSFDPVSAGMIDFYQNKGEVECHCHGKSVSLNMKSSEEDTMHAKMQILNNFM